MPKNGRYIDLDRVYSIYTQDIQIGIFTRTKRKDDKKVE